MPENPPFVQAGGEFMGHHNPTGPSIKHGRACAPSGVAIVGGPVNDARRNVLRVEYAKAFAAKLIARNSIA